MYQTLSRFFNKCITCTHAQFEADRRAFIITINSFGTELTMDDREKLYPTCGRLHPEGLARLAKCEDYEQVKGVADCYPVSLPQTHCRSCKPIILALHLRHLHTHTLYECTVEELVFFLV